MFAPAGTPAAIVNRLNREIVQILNRPDVKAKFLNTGIETVGDSPETLAALIKAEIERMGKVIKAAGIRAE
jgi:tripartite-type tricarboxylate transporter receptor subunit TctC